MSIKFTLKHQDNLARTGIITTAHNHFETPVFMPVGTRATIKGLTVDMINEIGFKIILANTYHLMLAPGEDIIHNQGGVQKFMNWNGSLLTDSGGFQVMSLSNLRKLTEDGVTFQSHIDGTKYHLTPEKSVQIQHKLNSNITMVLDECIPYGASDRYVLESTQLTTRWANVSK